MNTRKFNILNESVAVSDDIVKILRKYSDLLIGDPEKTGIKKIEDPFTDSKFTKIEPSSTDNMLDVTTIDGQGRERVQASKITKTLTTLYPHINWAGDKTAIQLLGEIRMITGKQKERYRFDIYDDIVYWYKELKIKWGVSSCVVSDGKAENGDTDRLLSGMNKFDDLQIVVLWDNEFKRYVGRALLWNNVKGINGPFLDRTYPGSDEQIHAVYTNWAEKQGYEYRVGMGYNDYRNVSNRNVKMKYDCKKVTDEDIVVFPYMDTFKWCTVHNKTGKVTLFNYEPSTTVGTVYGSLTNTGGYKIYTKPICDICNKPIKKDEEIHRARRYDRVCDECFKKFKKCKWCGADYIYNGKTDDLSASDELTFVSSENAYICRSCISGSDKFTQCDKCQNFDFKGENKPYIRSDGRTAFICPKCVDQFNINTCTKCGKFTEKLKEVVVDGKLFYVCKECGDKFLQCRSCERYFYGSDLWYSNNYLFNNCYCDPCFQKQCDSYREKFGEESLKNQILSAFTFYNDLSDNDKDTIKTKSIIKEGTSKRYNDLYTTILAEMNGFKQL